MLISGKRYEWNIQEPFDGRVKDGLFTGDYDENNGNAILLTKNGEVWSIPVEDLRIKEKRNK